MITSFTKSDAVDYIIVDMRISQYRTNCPQCKHEYTVDINTALEKEHITCYSCHRKFIPDLVDEDIEKVKRFNELAIELEKKFGVHQGILMKSYL